MTRIEELTEESRIAFSEYYKLAIKPCTNPSKSDLEQLNKATERYEAIREELENELKKEKLCLSLKTATQN